MPPYAVVGGVPAHIIRYRFSEDEIAVLEQSRWYEHEIAEAKQILNELYRSGKLTQKENR